MITRILNWWQRPSLRQIILNLRRDVEAIQKDLAALRAQGEAVKAMKRAIDVLVTENQKYRDRAQEMGPEWNTLCCALGLPVPCTIVSAIKMINERKTSDL